MRSIERRFKEIEAKNPYYSTYTCFALAIAGQKFTKETIRRHFNRLVDKDDYDKKDKKEVLEHLFKLSFDVEKVLEGNRK